MSDPSTSGKEQRESFYCTHCEAKNWAPEDAESVECDSCGREFDVTRYGPWERLRDNMLDANGLIAGGDGGE